MKEDSNNWTTNQRNRRWK